MCCSQCYDIVILHLQQLYLPPTHLIVLIRCLTPQDVHKLLHHTEASEDHSGRGDIQQCHPPHLCQLGLQRHPFVEPLDNKQEGYSSMAFKMFVLTKVKETDHELKTLAHKIKPLHSNKDNRGIPEKIHWQKD